MNKDLHANSIKLNSNKNDQLISILNLVQNLNINKNELDEVSNFIQNETVNHDKIGIMEALNCSNIIRDRYRDDYSIDHLPTTNRQNNSTLNSIHDECYTFGNERENPFKDQKEENYANYSSHVKSNHQQKNNDNLISKNKLSVKEINKHILEFKNSMYQVLNMICTFSDNLDDDIKDSPNLEFIVVHEKCLNSLLKINDAFNETLIKTKHELENTYHSFTEQRSLSINKELTSSIYEIAKSRSTVFKDETKKYLLNQTDTDKSFSNRLNNFNLNSNHKQNISYANFENSFDRFSNYYNDEINKKDEEIKEMTANLNYCKNLIETSRCLIDDLYNKNKLLKEKLIKYKQIKK